MRIATTIWQKFSPLLLLAGISSWHSTTMANDVFYNGRATGVTGTLTVNTTVTKALLVKNVVDTRGQDKDITLLSVKNPDPLNINAASIKTFTSGRNEVTQAYAALEDLHIKLPGLEVQVHVLESYAEARCIDGVIVPSGYSNILDLYVNGTKRTVTGSPNQAITIPNVGTIIVNEQMKYKKVFKVNALRIKLSNPSFPASSDIIVSEAVAEISACQVASC